VGNPVGEPPPPVRGPGLNDAPAVGINVWTPGERFLDTNNNDRWDGIDEKNDRMCHHPEGCQNVCTGLVCSDGSGYCSTDADCAMGEACKRGSLKHCSDGSGTICVTDNDCAGPDNACLGANQPCRTDAQCGAPETCGDRGRCMGLFCAGSSTPCSQPGNDPLCPPGSLCLLGSASGETCKTHTDCTRFTTPPFPSEMCIPPGPRGCDTRGCGDLAMPAIDFDGDDSFNSTTCTVPLLRPCNADADCGVGDGPQAGPIACLTFGSGSNAVSLCDPSKAVPCTSDDDCGELVCNTVLGFCVPPDGDTGLPGDAQLCYVPPRSDEEPPDLPDCCAEGLETDQLTACVAEGGIILADRYPNEPDATNLPEGIVCGNSIFCCEFDNFDQDNGTVDFAEPFEDFLVKWTPSGSSPGSVWTPVSREYIKNNYPGDAQALAARTGNGYYDPPDMFFDTLDENDDAVSTKMMQDAGVNQYSYVIPKPGTFALYVEHTDEPEWFDDWWTTRYGSTPPPWIPSVPPLSYLEGVRMRPFEPDAPNPPIVGSETDRRWFRSNRGGWDGAGSGTQQEPNLLFALGGNDWDSDILPEEEFGYYDGWVEHDDLASSRYHSAGDKRLGEITSPSKDTVNLPGGSYTAIFGADLGQHNPLSPNLDRDFMGVLAGPGAINIHGEKGYDAGDVCLTEWLTWRRDGKHLTVTDNWELENGTYHPFATPAATAAYLPPGRCTPNVLVPCTTSSNCQSAQPGGQICDQSTGTCRLANEVMCTGNGSDCPAGYSCSRPEEAFGFRDYNLDGMIDQGEVRPELSENYSIDSNPFSPNSGSGSDYPFNRSRLMEDVVEALDPSVDWDGFIDDNFVNNGQFCSPSTDTCTTDSDCYNNGLCRSGTCCYPSARGTTTFTHSNTLVSGIVIVPAGSYNSPNLFPGSPLLNWPIHTQDNSSSPFFSDLVICSDCRDEPAAIAYAAHEYLHAWERYPDLYDYDVYEEPGTAVVNCPIGRWDIMAGSRGNAGAIVHPVPPLKENRSGWIESVSLKTVLTPNVETTLILPPAELVRDNSYYYLENDVADSSGQLRGERYYFWSAGSGTDRAFPGRGMLILKTNDFRANAESLALQQRTDPFNFRIVQADGRNDLVDCSSGGNTGDGGDVWPGTSNVTRFNFETNPRAIWQDGRWTGLDITNVVADPDGSVQLTLQWRPTNIPGLRFIHPPGGSSVGDLYRIQYEATDIYGGTDILLYYVDADSVTGLPDPASATPVFGTCTDGSRCSVSLQDCGAGSTCAAVANPLRKSTTGTTQFTEFWNASQIPNGRYFLFAKLVPGTTPDGTEQASTLARGGRNNQGNGSVQDLIVNVGPNDANTARTESWVLQCIDGNGQEWLVNGSQTQPTPNNPGDDPYPHAFTCGAATPNCAAAGRVYTSLGGAVSFVIKEGTEPFGLGDRFTFATTGITEYSQALTIEDGLVQTNPTAVIAASTDSGSAPLTVLFDARGSTDPEGLPLTFAWDFGPGEGTASGAQTSHTYETDGEFTVTLRATNSVGKAGIDTVDVIVTNSSPTAVISAVEISGPAPRDVIFSANGSFDQETQDPNELIYQWSFGDGASANPQGLPGEAMTDVHHFYDRRTDGSFCSSSNPCKFTATLTVTDAGGKSDDDSIEIVVGNSNPLPSITVSPTSGTSPLSVTFNAIGSSDADGDGIDVVWDFDDNTAPVRYPTSGPPGVLDGKVVHEYVLPAGILQATYHPTALLFDVRGGVDRGGISFWVGPTITVTSPEEVIVENQPPIASFVFNANGDPVVEGGTVVFDASASSDPEGGVLRYRWDFDDGTPVQFGTGTDFQTRTHVYASPGSYTVLLTVTDDENASVDTTRQVVVLSAVGNRPPVPVLADGTRIGPAPLTVQLNGQLSYDPDGDPLSFRFEFTGGNGEDEVLEGNSVVTKTFEIEGVYTVVMKVDDGIVAANDVPSVSAQIRVTSPITVPEPPPGTDKPPTETPAGSHTQRPTGTGAFCGFGMLPAFFASLLGLGVLRLSRRRF